MNVEDLCRKAVEEQQVAGLNLLVLKNQKEVLYTQAGYADVEKKVPYDRDRINRIYSMSKPITAAAVMILIDRGQLSLNSPIAKFLPGFASPKVWENGKSVPAHRGIYVRDCMNMTSGLCYGGEVGCKASEETQELFDEIDRKLYTDEALSTVEIANRLGECHLAYHPGDGWKYGTSADVLGAVVEVVSGVPFGVFLEEEIFAPLGMKDTGFVVPKEKRDRMPTVYEWEDEVKQVGLKVCHTNHLGIRYLKDEKPAFESGGAGLASTLDDYALFANMLMKGGEWNGKRILSEETARFFVQGQMLPWQREYMWRTWDSLAGHDYANLLRKSTEPLRAYYQTWPNEYGWDGWLGTYFCNSPSNGVTILMGMQQTNAGGMDLFQEIRNVLMQE